MLRIAMTTRDSVSYMSDSRHSKVNVLIQGRVTQDRVEPTMFFSEKMIGFCRFYVAELIYGLGTPKLRSYNVFHWSVTLLVFKENFVEPIKTAIDNETMRKVMEKLNEVGR